MIHKILWLLRKKYSPGCAFPPQAARRRPNLFKYKTKQLTMFETMIFGSDLVWWQGKKTAQELILGKIVSVSQPGHWCSISLLTPRDAQSDSRIFFNYLSPSQIAFLSLMTKAYYAWMYLLIVRWQAEKRAVQIAVLATVGGLFFLAVRAALPPLFVFVGACSCQACLCSLRYCLSVCLSG